MKKIIALLILMSMMLALCAACGGSKEDTSAPAVSEAVESVAAEEELPTVQRNTNTGDNQDETGMIAAEDNKAAGANVDTDWLASLSEERRYVEENLIGCLVQDLIDYLGEPISSEYTTSCLVSDGMDGLLFYDGFLVSTTRFANGTEIIQGTEDN